MTTTLAGIDVLDLVLTIPRRGAWSAEVTLAAPLTAEGVVDLVVEGRTWRGSVARGAAELGRWRGRIVGALALLSDLAPQAFRSTTLGEVLAETLRAAGLAPATGMGDLSAVAAHWHRPAQSAARTVAAIADAAGYGWRVRRDGTVWVGPETWDVSSGEPALLDVDAALGRYTLAEDAALDVEPGTVVQLRDGDADTFVRVGLVEHRQGDTAVRSIVWAESDAPHAGVDRLRAAIVSIVRAELRPLTFALWRPCTVVSQSGDLLDLRPDDPSFAAPPGVPYRTLPGVTLTIPAGTRMLLGYEGGDPRRPVAVLAELADVTRLAVNGGAAKVARDGEAVTSSTAMGAWITAVSGLLNAPGAVIGGPGTVTPPTGAIGAVSGGSDVLRVPNG